MGPRVGSTEDGSQVYVDSEVGVQGDTSSSEAGVMNEFLGRVRDDRCAIAATMTDVNMQEARLSFTLVGRAPGAKQDPWQADRPMRPPAEPLQVLLVVPSTAAWETPFPRRLTCCMTELTGSSVLSS